MLDKQAIVFHHGSGETHCLDEEASLILLTIMHSQAPISESTLLGMAVDAGLQRVDPQSLAGMLGVLQSIQVVENI
ncbi:HPr-rel-A system PqqD family peptide chaperone [Methylomonas fluvii]|uniref:HPr-rel-A system PqqD family peptide chaperone n=1 Tax=Methylomonas fluvii TaxID=1854564 RepID=UPI0018A75BF5|nr:HPr-rel-A system PqqD family peptide chaperone [Methylomonas fluvii]